MCSLHTNLRSTQTEIDQIRKAGVYFEKMVNSEDEILSRFTYFLFFFWHNVISRGRVVPEWSDVVQASQSRESSSRVWGMTPLLGPHVNISSSGSFFFHQPFHWQCHLFNRSTVWHILRNAKEMVLHNVGVMMVASHQNCPRWSYRWLYTSERSLLLMLWYLNFVHRSIVNSDSIPVQ